MFGAQDLASNADLCLRRGYLLPAESPNPFHYLTLPVDRVLHFAGQPASRSGPETSDTKGKAKAKAGKELPDGDADVVMTKTGAGEPDDGDDSGGGGPALGPEQAALLQSLGVTAVEAMLRLGRPASICFFA